MHFSYRRLSFLKIGEVPMTIPESELKIGREAIEEQDIRACRAGCSDRDYLVHCRVVACTTKSCFRLAGNCLRGEE